MSDRPKKRVRRTAEEARRLILDAAEERLATGGPEALRLQDIAADVGISHPAILHHFESRDGLVMALTVRTLESLRDNLMTVLEAIDLTNPDASAIIQKVFEVLSDRGLARLLAWVVLSGRLPQQSMLEGVDQFIIKDIADTIHSMREKAAKEHGMPVATRADTINIVMLAASAAFGEAVFGNSIMDSLGVEDTQNEVRSGFRKWFARVLEFHLVTGSGMDDPYAKADPAAETED